VEIAYPHSHLVFDDTSGEAQVSVSRSGEGAVDPDSRAMRHGSAAGEEQAGGDGPTDA